MAESVAGRARLKPARTTARSAPRRRCVTWWIGWRSRRCTYSLVDRGRAATSGINCKRVDELLEGEFFDRLDEAKVLFERWRRRYNAVRPFSALSYRPPASEGSFTEDRASLRSAYLFDLIQPLHY